MTSKIGLYEYLSIPASDLAGSVETRLTEADGETYDDDGHALELVAFSADDGQTTFTRVENETVDDDGGTENLQHVGATDHVETYFTKEDNETVDDAGSTGLSFPMP